MLPERAAHSADWEALGCSTSAPFWPVFTHPKSICITASFMSSGQCLIHTVWECVCVCSGERLHILSWSRATYFVSL